jgi:hypothetical protein
MPTMAENLGFEYGASPGHACPVVTRVDDRGPAKEAGVELGDEIVAVDGMSMAQGDVLSLLSTSPGEMVQLLLRQGGVCDAVRNPDPESRNAWSWSPMEKQGDAVQVKIVRMTPRFRSWFGACARIRCCRDVHSRNHGLWPNALNKPTF